MLSVSISFLCEPKLTYQFSIPQEHTNFVNCVRYAPDGSVFATAGADGKVVWNFITDSFMTDADEYCYGELYFVLVSMSSMLV